MTTSSQHYDYRAPLFKNERTTYERIEKFISSDYFLDCNLRGRLYGASVPLTVQHISVGNETINFSEAVRRLNSVEYVNIGHEFGPTWTNSWFCVTCEIPADFIGNELVVRFDPSCEALVWNRYGKAVQSLSPDFGHIDIRLCSEEVCQYYIEACAVDRNHAIEAVNLNKYYVLKKASLCVYRADISELLVDLDLLLEMSKLLPKDGTARRYEALYTANDLTNQLVLSDFSPDIVEGCHLKAMQFFNQPNSPSQIILHAIGNCHIDTAWLWRFSETKGKCARSWSNTLQLMNTYNMFFVISQAQQLFWLSQQYPSIYEDIKVRCADKRFITVGGCWVEMDGNLPSGESFIRQILYGVEEFRKISSTNSRVFWLPDTFGYCAQLPQIIKHCGMSYFVTQKMSWSLVNKFQHSSFWWVGIDGTEILTHFPPHNYASQITVKECLESDQNFMDKGRSKIAMMLYGHGDGGGGPDENMLKRAIRLRDCDGIPRLLQSTPEDFFKELEKDSINLCKWNGELYLELHNATYTTHSRLKKMNRMLENLLRDHEFLQTLKLCYDGCFKSLENEWKKVLLNQFHDILPGTCIKEVVSDALKIYDECFRALSSSTDGSAIDMLDSSSDPQDEHFFLNSSSWTRSFYHDGHLYRIPSLSVTRISNLEKCETYPEEKLLKREGSGFTLRNRFLKAVIDQFGRITSLSVHAIGEVHCKEFEAIALKSFGNQFVIYDDVPLFWDAWDVMDYHLETRRPIIEVLSADVMKDNEICSAVRFKLRISLNSYIVQEISLRSDLPYIVFDTFVHWYESHKFLKVEFPVNIRNKEALYDVPFGFVGRTTNRNTSWDSAKFEVCGHKWAALTEYGRGVAILNDCKYGHACEDNIMRLSLLRSSKYPDDEADMGSHTFSYALYPFMGQMQQPENCKELNVIRAAFDFNNPVRCVHKWSGKSDITNFLTVEGSEGIFISSIKPAEQLSNAFVIRLFESFGGSVECVKLSFNNRLSIRSVKLTNGLERSLENLSIEYFDASNVHSKYIHLSFRAFEIKTLVVEL